MRHGRGLTGPLLLLFGAGLVALAAARAARRRVDLVEVRGRSMAPTLLPGDRLLVVRMSRSPRPGDVVLALDPRGARRELVKRVAAVDAFGVALRGDNPALSTDGRVFGSVPVERVRWRAVLRYWPRGRIGPLPPAPPEPAGGESACAFPDALVAG